MRRLVRKEPGVATMRDEDGLSPILLAVYNGRREVVDALLAAEPQLDVFEAAATGGVGRVLMLLDEDPELVSALSPDGFSALHLAAFFGNAEAVELLVERGAPLEAYASSDFAPVTPLQSAAAANETDIARLLLEAGANANARGRDGGFTPLHAAAQNGNAELVRLLLERGADRGARTDDGRTPADLAANDEVRALLA